MHMKNIIPMKKIPLFTLCLFMLGACTPEANRENLTQGMNDYLSKHGNLCLAKQNWPIEITPADFAAGMRDAIQMPVLQKLGLISVSDVSVKTKDGNKTSVTMIKRYQLTEDGKKYYLTRESDIPASSDGKHSPKGDLCVAQLTLDKIVAWEPLTDNNALKETLVTYTYNVKAATWLQDPDAKRVFPMIDRVVQGAHVAQLKEAFVLSKNGWVAKAWHN